MVTVIAVPLCFAAAFLVLIVNALSARYRVFTFDNCGAGRTNKPDIPYKCQKTSASLKNPTYFPLTPQSLTDFDWLAVLDRAAYSRSGPPLQQ